MLAKCDAFRQIPELREPVLLHEGLFEWFYEEIYPLSVFAARRYGDCDDVHWVPKRDPSRDVDAEICQPSGTIRLEITCAREPSEHLRMGYLVEHDGVSLTGGLKDLFQADPAVEDSPALAVWPGTATDPEGYG